MSLAVVIKHVDTPVDAFDLAGRPATAYAQLAAEELAPAMTVTVSCMSQIGPQVEAWTRSGVDQVLLLESNRPLLTAGNLRGLLERSAAGVTKLALTGAGGHTAVLCLPVDSLAHHVTASAADSGLAQMARAVGASYVAADDAQACMALDSLKALVVAERILCQRLCDQWLEVGVHIVDPATTYLHSTVMIGAGTRILPNTHLLGETLIGECAEVGPNTIVRDSKIGHRCRIFASVVEDAVMDAESSIGPFGHLRKGAHLCQGAYMGNFGEVKNSVLGPNSKMGHFSYLGDATVGRDVNIGAGTITCNYDGTHKHRTIIRDGAFIGSDAMLVAPVEIGQNARIGAGSVVTRNVPDGAVAYGVPARVKRGSVSEEEESGGTAD